MNPFQYTRSSAAASAIQSLVKEPQAHLLAGGTNLIDLMKMGVVVPERLVDINPLHLRSVE
jgi:xanthine dehydrogenase YagS FAD-binding subunit